MSIIPQFFKKSTKRRVFLRETFIKCIYVVLLLLLQVMVKNIMFTSGLGAISLIYAQSPAILYGLCFCITCTYRRTMKTAYITSYYIYKHTFDLTDILQGSQRQVRKDHTLGTML